MKYLIFFFTGITSVNFTIAQDGNYAFIRRIPLTKHYNTDIPITDTVPEIQNGYFEITLKSNAVNNMLLQGKCYTNNDSTITLVIIGQHADQQCEFYHSYFYEYAMKSDSIKIKSESDFIPELSLEQFFKDSHIPMLVSKYFDAFNEQYKGDRLTKAMILNDLYSIRYILSANKTALTATLNLCDYDLNEIKMTPKEINWIQTDFKKFNLQYNSKTKKFVFK